MPVGDSDFSERLLKYLKESNLLDKESSRSYIFDCPICGGKDKLYMDKSSGRSVCFRAKSEECPRSGSQPYFTLSKMTGESFVEVKKRLSGGPEQLQEKLQVFFEDSDDAPSKTPLPPLEMAEYPADSIPILKNSEPFQYLTSRGISFDQAQSLQLMYSPGMRRIIFPSIVDGKIVGWQGRAIDKVDHAYRMYNYPGPWKSRAVLFLETIKSDSVVICEGPFDAMKFLNVGSYVATMGKSISKAQLDLLFTHGVKKFFLGLDEDANDKLDEIYRHLKSYPSDEVEVFIVKVPEGREDFGDCSYEEAYQAYMNARPMNGQEILIYMD